MSEPIKVGDLVIVVQSHCSAAAAVEMGLIRTVLSVDSGRGYELRCRDCGNYYKAPPMAEVAVNGWHPLAWLKRIPPLEELDDVQREEEITA